MGTFNKRETSGNHHYVSLILFSSHSPARRGGKWNRFEDPWNPSSRRPVEFFSNSFQFLAHFNAWKTSSSPDSSWIASSRRYLIRLNIYIYCSKYLFFIPNFRSRNVPFRLEYQYQDKSDNLKISSSIDLWIISNPPSNPRKVCWFSSGRGDERFVEE